MIILNDEKNILFFFYKNRIWKKVIKKSYLKLTLVFRLSILERWGNFIEGTRQNKPVT